MPDLTVTQVGSQIAKMLSNRALTSALTRRTEIPEPDYASIQDPNAWDIIRRDPVPEAAMNFRRHLIAGAEWHMQAGGDRPEDKLLAEWVEHVIAENLDNFTAARFQLAAAPLRGMTWALINGERRLFNAADTGLKNIWVPTKLSDKSKFRFRQAREADDEGRSRIVWQMWDVGANAWRKIERMEWFVRNIYDDNEDQLGYGRGQLDTLYNWHRYKMASMRMALRGLERWAGGWAVVKINRNKLTGTTQTATQLASSYVSTIEKMMDNAVVAIDSDDEIDLIQGGGEGWQIAREVINMLNEDMVRVILGSIRPTGNQGGDGAFAGAQAAVEQDSTAALIEFDRCQMEEAITRDLVGLVIRLNRDTLMELGLLGARRPKFKVRTDQAPDATSAVAVIEAALRSKVPLLKSEVYAQLGFTPPAEDEEVFEGIEDAQAGGLFGPFGSPANVA